MKIAEQKAWDFPRANLLRECAFRTGAQTALDPDRCDKRLSDCKLRFAETELPPFGGFAAAGLTR